MSDLDDHAVEPHEMAQRHEVPEWHQDPGENVPWRNIREQGLVLDHSDRVDGEKKSEMGGQLLRL